jgi:Nickel responsive protein SCO4226-like
MARVVVEQVFDPPMSDEDYGKIAARLDPCLDARNAMWRRSYVAPDKRRVTCEFEAADAESVRDAFRMAGLKYERAWTAEVFAVEDYPELMEKLAKLTAK